MRSMFLLWAGLTAPLSFAQTRFDDNFEDGCLRFDYFHGLDRSQHVVIPDAIVYEPLYGGSREVLINPFNMGSVRYFVLDSAAGDTLYGDAYSSMFDEWRSTQAARRGERKVYHESIRMPCPRRPIRLVIENRSEDGSFQRIYESYINPLDIAILRDTVSGAWEAGSIRRSGPPQDKIDVVFLAEGYRVQELDKFKKDAERLTDFLLGAEPFQSHSDRFNFWYVATPSEESGTDEPDKGIYRNTFFHSSFNTFNVARYITSSANRLMRTAASKVPYDHIVVLTNSGRYGGGGFYNLYSLFCADMPYLRDVFVHEFGHQFGGLADEYDGDFTDGYYNLEVEPWEANITTATQRRAVKWRSMIDDAMPVPTPADVRYAGRVGLFEGAGYSTRGIFRSELYCIMRSFEVREFCAVCRGHVRNVILTLTR